MPTTKKPKAETKTKVPSKGRIKAPRRTLVRGPAVIDFTVLSASAATQALSRAIARRGPLWCRGYRAGKGQLTDHLFVYYPSLSLLVIPILGQRRYKVDNSLTGSLYSSLHAMRLDSGIGELVPEELAHVPILGCTIWTDFLTLDAWRSFFSAGTSPLSMILELRFDKWDRFVIAPADVMEAGERIESGTACAFHVHSMLRSWEPPGWLEVSLGDDPRVTLFVEEGEHIVTAARLYGPYEDA